MASDDHEDFSGLEPKSREEKLLDLTESTKYQLIQRNGQRIYGGPPPGWVGPPPEKGCEVTLKIF